MECGAQLPRDPITAPRQRFRRSNVANDSEIGLAAGQAWGLGGLWGACWWAAAGWQPSGVGGRQASRQAGRRQTQTRPGRRQTDRDSRWLAAGLVGTRHSGRPMQWVAVAHCLCYNAALCQCCTAALLEGIAALQCSTVHSAQCTLHSAPVQCSAACAVCQCTLSIADKHTHTRASLESI